MSAKPGRGTRPTIKVFPLHPGRIVWAPITPTKGVKKQRRSVVLMELPDNAARPGRRFLVVGVTCDGGEFDPTDAVKYPPDAYIQIPHAEDGSCETTFRLPSAAYAEFVEGFHETELQATEGCLQTDLLDALILKLKAYVAKTQP